MSKTLDKLKVELHRKLELLHSLYLERNKIDKEFLEVAEQGDPIFSMFVCDQPFTCNVEKFFCYSCNGFKIIKSQNNIFLIKGMQYSKNLSVNDDRFICNCETILHFKDNKFVATYTSNADVQFKTNHYIADIIMRKLELFDHDSDFTESDSSDSDSESKTTALLF